MVPSSENKETEQYHNANGKVEKFHARLPNDVKALGVQSLADHSNLPLIGCRAFVLDGTKLFHDKTQNRTALRDAMRVRTPELQQNGKRKLLAK